MKKPTLISIFLLGCFSTVLSQQIRFEKSLEKAQKLSIEKNKPLALIINIETPLSSFQEKTMASMLDPLSGLNDIEVSKKFNENFIIYKVNYKPNNEDTAIRKIISNYRISRFPAFIFIDTKGGVILRDFGAATTPKKYLLMLESAISASNQKSIIDYDEQYKSGKYDAQFLKEYIAKRREVEILNNADLIEKYVDFLSVADLDNYKEVLFILQAGPYAYGKAYKLALLNKQIIDSIFKTEPLSVRMQMNNATIGNSFNDAVSSKSVAKANMVAAFVRVSWGSNYREAAKQSVLKMIQFYQAIKDTNNYLQQASFYYDQYYMKIGLDSIKKLEAINAESIKKNISSMAAKKILSIDSIKIDTTKVLRTQIQQSIFSVSSSNNYATDLNNAAWAFYLTGTKNITYLNRAMSWSKRSIEITPNAAFYDTLAHLQYLLGNFAESEGTQEKAIELANQEKQDVKKYQEELLKIKNKTL